MVWSTTTNRKATMADTIIIDGTRIALPAGASGYQHGDGETDARWLWGQQALDDAAPEGNNTVILPAGGPPPQPPATHDFGGGPVLARRHENLNGSPGGWVANTAHVEEDCVVDAESTVSGATRVGGRCEIVRGAHIAGPITVCEGVRISGRISMGGAGLIRRAAENG